MFTRLHYLFTALADLCTYLWEGDSSPFEGFVDYVPEPAESVPVELAPVAPYWRTIRPDYSPLAKRWVMWLFADTATVAFVYLLPGYFESAFYDPENRVYALYFTPEAGRDQDSAENTYKAVCVSLEARFQAPIGTVETLGVFKDFIETLNFALIQEPPITDEDSGADAK